MNTFSIHFNFSSSGFDLNLFNQLDVYFSYTFIAIVVIAVVALRIRKVIKDKYRAKKIYDAIENIKASDNPFDEWNL